MIEILIIEILTAFHCDDPPPGPSDQQIEAIFLVSQLLRERQTIRHQWTHAVAHTRTQLRHSQHSQMNISLPHGPPTNTTLSIIQHGISLHECVHIEMTVLQLRSN